ncbi:Cyclin-D4-1 [Vitis vinifera]|uniref:Cyclin-D4-1 n=1 Tax=Vitis vinifera TaxID=29760 RepID=A0A438CLN1_VITVI|nr:Cyclin-D4-1 [Vitis vinifera]
MPVRRKSSSSKTDVPLLLDLQVEERKYVFEVKTIQRIELLVLSTLQWKGVSAFSSLSLLIRGSCVIFPPP